MIEVRNVYKQFRDNHVLSGVDIDIEEGKTVAIIGQSGCGKSVLLKTIVGLIEPDAGSILVDNKTIVGATREELEDMRSHFSYLFQGGALFDSMTILENVAFPIVWGTNRHAEDADITSKVKEVLAMVGLKNVEYLKPSELSGGMKKRAALARAVIENPKYIFYDEPTTGLDPVMSANIDALITGLQKDLGLTSVVVTHDMETVYRIADRIFMLYQGKVVFDGSPKEIKKSDSPIVQQFINRRENGPIVV